MTQLPLLLLPTTPNNNSCNSLCRTEHLVAPASPQLGMPRTTTYSRTHPPLPVPHENTRPAEKRQSRLRESESVCVHGIDLYSYYLSKPVLSIHCGVHSTRDCIATAILMAFTVSTLYIAHLKTISAPFNLQQYRYSESPEQFLINFN